MVDPNLRLVSALVVFAFTGIVLVIFTLKLGRFLGRSDIRGDLQAFGFYGMFLLAASWLFWAIALASVFIPIK